MAAWRSSHAAIFVEMKKTLITPLFILAVVALIAALATLLARRVSKSVEPVWDSTTSPLRYKAAVKSQTVASKKTATKKPAQTRKFYERNGKKYFEGSIGYILATNPANTWKPFAYFPDFPQPGVIWGDILHLANGDLNLTFRTDTIAGNPRRRYKNGVYLVNNQAFTGGFDLFRPPTDNDKVVLGIT
jgi:hypothetical protein